MTLGLVLPTYSMHDGLSTPSLSGSLSFAQVVNSYTDAHLSGIPKCEKFSWFFGEFY